MLAIFEMSTLNAKRFNPLILKNYKSPFLIYVDDIEHFQKINNTHVRVKSTCNWTINRISKSLKKNNVSLLIIHCFRIADLRMILAAKDNNIPVIYKMHGIYPDLVKRSILFYSINYAKSIRTIFYLLDIVIHTKNISFFYKIFLSFVFGKSRKSWMLGDTFNIDRALVWSAYWKKWHMQNWFIIPSKGWIITGNPDTQLINSIKTNKNGICYIYQTLVEDGRLQKKIMLDFLDKLEKFSNSSKVKIYVKWHGRGSEEMKCELIKRNFIVVQNLPRVNKFIGHTSSLLGLVPLLKSSLIIYKLKGIEIPIPLLKCASHIVYNFNELQNLLSDDKIKIAHKIKKTKYYFGEFYSS